MMDEDLGWRPPHRHALADSVSRLADTIEVQRRDRQRRRVASRRPGLLASLSGLAIVASWNVWLAARPSPMPSADQMGAGLRFEVGQVVLEIQAYRGVNGRLPTPDDIGYLLDRVVQYSLTEDGFLVTAEDGDVALAYDGSQPIEEWVGSGMP